MPLRNVEILHPGTSFWVVEELVHEEDSAVASLFTLCRAVGDRQLVKRGRCEEKLQTEWNNRSSAD
jgi:hypothetical protein